MDASAEEILAFYSTVEVGELNLTVFNLLHSLVPCGNDLFVGPLRTKGVLSLLWY